MKTVLILGGTRNLGHVTACALRREGYIVTVLNRGLTPDELPADVERLHAARGDADAIRTAIAGRRWDVVVDTTSYTGADARELVDVVASKCGRVIFISTGQVYLVRDGVRAPFSEPDYEGPLIPAPPVGTADHDNWLYGVNKRDAEEVLRSAASDTQPIVSLRLPMIASERDHYGRIQGYIARVIDGGPIVVPAEGSLPIRHVYVEDVARIIRALCTDDRAGFSALNISTTISISLDKFFEILASTLRTAPEIVRVERKRLESAGLIPTCSPYSGKWMSELDSSRSLDLIHAAGLTYTGVADYVARIAADYFSRWIPNGLVPPGYERRAEELDFAKKVPVKSVTSS